MTAGEFRFRHKKFPTVITGKQNYKPNKEKYTNKRHFANQLKYPSNASKRKIALKKSQF